MPFDFFSFTDKDHKKLHVESITLHHKIAIEMFLTCIPIVLVITLLEDSMRAFTITISRTCFVVRSTPLMLVCSIPKL
jgi:heme/copper-type cytochrome/quinol oxidase subunit 2